MVADGWGIQLGGCSPSDVSTDPVDSGRAASAAGRARRGGWVGYDERRLRWTESRVQPPGGCRLSELLGVVRGRRVGQRKPF